MMPAESKGVSDALGRALNIVAKAGRYQGQPDDGMTARGFAEAFWPNHTMNQRSYNCGAHGGSARGTGGVICAGLYLGKMAKAGLIYKMYPGGRRLTRYFLTTEGWKALQK